MLWPYRLVLICLHLFSPVMGYNKENHSYSK